ncbi:hypothetical protein ASC59_06000 [Leifsonia sp. Root1293]|nr:hypothetical protein ASC59_06000 [Leifsonia sp. Root1293]KRA11611.1 hypothetical protein ASD61_06000 [Leifsonia sp. Root60]
MEPNLEQTDRVDMRAWLGDEYGRMLRQHPLGSAWVDEIEGPLPRGQWITTKETDKIHALPEAVRDELFDFDDAIREALKA